MRPRVLLAELNAAGVDYVLIGGLAATLKGTTRVTRDIDIAYASDARNVERLCTVLNALEPRLMHLGQEQGDVVTLTAAFLKRSRMLQLSTQLGEVDLLRDVDGFKSYAAIKALSEEYAVPESGGITLILSIDGLLKAKRAMKRPKDQQDIVELEALKELRSFEASLRDDGPSTSSG